MAHPASPRRLPRPAIHPTRPVLRVLGTEITLLEAIRTRAEADLGISIVFDTRDFLSAQRKAATDPGSFDIYDQCFHNLDIVWFWHALQAIDTARITRWDEMSNLSRTGRLGPHSQIGVGDAPVKKLFVQGDGSLGTQPTRSISMLPTVHNLDGFAYDDTVAALTAGEAPSWAWLLDSRFSGRVALVDEPAIGIFDAALAAQASGQVQFGDLGNITLGELDRLFDLLMERKQARHFCGTWRTGADCASLVRSGRAAVESIWSPTALALAADGASLVQAVPVEGYRAWHGGLALSSALSAPMRDVAYAYLNWWLDGAAGAIVARQGYYMSVSGPIRTHLSPPEWDYWYEGQPAATALPGVDGRVVVRPGQVRSGGSYAQRANRIAVWNTTMDEHNYLVRRWRAFTA
jgi:putative spermidine/putrescine transport system substrate-binding protein